MDLKELREDAEAYAPTWSIDHDAVIDLINRVEAVVKEMREAAEEAADEGRSGNPGWGGIARELSDFADRLEGKQPEGEWNPKEKCWP